jgi:predicted alpha/beta hydrolase family esterase
LKSFILFIISIILSFKETITLIKEIYLIGHSTGCQDILCLCKKGIQKEFPIKKCILQGPVSDRDYVEKEEELLNEIKRIEKEYNIPYKDWNFSDLKNSLDISKYLYDGQYPLLIRRFISLYSKLGDEDWFSFDISQDEFNTIYSCVTIPLLFIFSLNDQYVNYTHEDYQKLIKKIENANKNINTYALNDDHYIENSKDEFYKLIKEFFCK